MARIVPAGLVVVLLWSSAMLAIESAEFHYQVGDYLTYMNTEQGPLVSFFYANGTSVCTQQICAVYNLRAIGVYETVDGQQVEGSGVGLANLPWDLSFQKVLNDPLCDCTTMMFNATNDGTGTDGAWDSLTLSVHVPDSPGTTHGLVELVVQNYQWQTPGHLEVAKLVVDTTFVATDREGATTNSELSTDDATTVVFDSGYFTLAPTAEAVADGSHLIVGANLNVTSADVQLIFQSYPNGYELVSEMRIGISSATDPGVFPFGLTPYGSAEESESQTTASKTWLNWIIGISLGLLVLFVAIIVVTGLLWMHQPSRRFLQRTLNRHTLAEEGGLVT